MRSVEVVHDGKGCIFSVYSHRCALMWFYIEKMFGRNFTLENVENKTFVYNSMNGDCFCVIETKSVA